MGLAALHRRTAVVTLLLVVNQDRAAPGVVASGALHRIPFFFGFGRPTTVNRAGDVEPVARELPGLALQLVLLLPRLDGLRSRFQRLGHALLAFEGEKVVGGGRSVMGCPEDLVLVLPKRFDPRANVRRVTRWIVGDPLLRSQED